MDLLERADELTTLHRLLAETTAGGRVAVLSGEAGAGKSTLATAFVEGAGPRAHVLWGACDPLLTPRALGPLHDIARVLGGRLRDRIGDGPRSEVFDLLLEALDRPPQSARRRSLRACRRFSDRLRGLGSSLAHSPKSISQIHRSP